MGFRIRSNDRGDRRTRAQKQVDAYRVKNTVSVHSVLEAMLGGAILVTTTGGAPVLRKGLSDMCGVPVDLMRMLKRNKYVIQDQRVTTSFRSRKLVRVTYKINPDAPIQDAIRTSKENEKRMGTKPAKT